MEGVKRVSPSHRNVHQGGGEESEAVEVGRGADDHGGIISGLRKTFGDSVGTQIYWEVDHGIVLRLARGGRKYEEGA